MSEPRITSAKTVLGDSLELHGLTGHEALSEPFLFVVTLVSDSRDNEPIDPNALLGTVVKVSVDREYTGDNSTPDHPTRYFNGVVTKISMEGMFGSFRLYRVELRPWLWLLDKTKDCRIFQNQTVPEIVEEVFKARGFKDYRFQLGTYKPREYCVQYRESDLDFVSRLLEHEGIYYFFEFEENKHTLVLTDGSTAHQPRTTYETIDYGPKLTGEAVETFGGRINFWRPKQELRAENYALRDYDFTKPRKPVDARQNGKQNIPQNTFEKFDYPGGYTDVSTGNDYATVRLLEEQVPLELVEGDAQSQGLSPGYLFTLKEHPYAAQNTSYLTISADYDFALPAYEGTDELQPRPWICKFTALESGTQFRPARVTPRPVIPGLQTAKVVGPKSEEIHTDRYGRVKVRFHWDRKDTLDENASCFIRTAQMWAGPSWGSQYLPRVGHEVVVSFLEGDPDQPLIVGSVYNGLNLPAFELPAQKEVSGVKSKSTLNGGKGYNELSFDDTTGKELVNFHAQNNHRAVVENKRYTEVGGDDTEVVKGTQNIDVQKQFVTVKTTYALRSLLSTEISCGPTVIKLTPLGISIMAPKIDITAPVFSLVSPTAVITPALYTIPLGPMPFVPAPPPVPTIAPPALDTTGGKQSLVTNTPANGVPTAPASPATAPPAGGKPPLTVDTGMAANGMPANGMPTPPGSPF